MTGGVAVVGFFGATRGEGGGVRAVVGGGKRKSGCPEQATSQIPVYPTKNRGVDAGGDGECHAMHRAGEDSCR